MPLTRKEFEAAARSLWPRHTDDRAAVRQRCEWLYGLSYAAPATTSVSEDAGFLWRVLETRAALPDHHRLLAAFPRPVEVA